MISFMETITREATIIRLKPQVMARVKYRAKSQGLSVNAYIEQTLAEATNCVPIPKLPPDFQISPEIKSFAGVIPQFTQEQLEEDPRLAYILGKGE